MASKYSFRFVCQGGGLDVKSAVLAASLLHFLRCGFELCACIPVGKNVDPPLSGVLDFFKEHEIRMVTIQNPIGPHYPIGNKMSCLFQSSGSLTRIFLDSDVLCLKPFYGFRENPEIELLAKLEDWNHHSQEEWEKVYSFFGLGPVVNNYRSTVLNQAMPLYFNAGLLVVNGHSKLPSKWIEAAKKMDRHLDIPRKMPNLDQLALAAAVLKHQIPFKLLSEDYNFPGELRPLDQTSLPFFCHYHDPIMVFADSYLSRTVWMLAKRFPLLHKIISDHDTHGWYKAAITRGQPVEL